MSLVIGGLPVDSVRVGRDLVQKVLHGSELVAHAPNLAPPFSEWELSGGAWLDDEGVLHFPVHGGQARSPLIPIHGAARWTISGEFYSDEVSPYYDPLAGRGYSSEYYGADRERVENSAGYTGNGNARPFRVGEWSDRGSEAVWSYEGGPNVKYIAFRLHNSPGSNNYYSPSLMARRPMLTVGETGAEAFAAPFIPYGQLVAP